jgi:hypothetical protein
LHICFEIPPKDSSLTPTSIRNRSSTEVPNPARNVPIPLQLVEAIGRPPKATKKKRKAVLEATTLEQPPITEGPPIRLIAPEYGGGSLRDTIATNVEQLPGRDEIPIGRAAEVLTLDDDAEGAEGNPIELNPELEGGAEPGTTEGTTGNTR